MYEKKTPKTISFLFQVTHSEWQYHVPLYWLFAVGLTVGWFCLLWTWRWVGFPKSCPHVVVIVPRMVTLCQFWGHRVWVKTFSDTFLRQFCFKLQFGSVFANLQFSLRPWLSFINLHHGFLHRMRKISNMTSNFIRSGQMVEGF